MQKETSVKELTGFELYLEGIKIPSFSSIQIRESEGSFPQASLSFPATSGILRILAGTIVQIFGPDLKDSNKKILLFEGEIVGSSLSKTSAGKTVSFTCSSFLNEWQNATVTPKDSLVTSRWREATNQKKEYENLTDSSREVEGQETNSTFSQVALSLSRKFRAESFDELPKLIDNIQLSRMGEFSSQMNKLLKDNTISKGDIQLLVNFFLRKFELQDPFFGIVSNSMKLTDSVFAFPNYEKLAPFIQTALFQNFQQFTASLANGLTNGSLNLFTGLGQILRTMHYTIISPSSYTSTLNFWGPNSIMRQGNAVESPTRAYFLPNLENSPPAKFNVIFPHEIESESFNWDMFSEPTRTIGYSTPTFSADLGIAGLHAFCTEPMLNITERGLEKNLVGLTPEETYKGIIVNKRSFDWLFTNSYFQNYANTEDDSIPPKDKYIEDIRGPLNQLTLQDHYRKKLATRTLSMNVSWSPYRMTGVPGAVISTDETPSFTGVISSISTSISGQGSASTTLTFRGVRIIHDVNAEDSREDVEDMINDYTIDPYVNSNAYLFDPELYDFQNIGKQLYTTLKWGTLTKNSKIKEYATSPGDSRILKGASSNINELERNRLYKQSDESILSVLRNVQGDIESELDVELLTDAFSSTFGASSQLTKYVYDSIDTLKRTYKSVSETSFLDKWALDFTYRKIISKGNYLSFLNIQDPIDRRQNYKDSIKLLTGTEATLRAEEAIAQEDREDTELSTLTIDELLNRLAALEDVKQFIEGEDYTEDEVRQSIASNQDFLSSTVIHQDHVPDIKEINKEISEVNQELDLREKSEEFKTFEEELYKVYNLTRRAHVKVGFSSYFKHLGDTENTLNITN